VSSNSDRGLYRSRKKLVIIFTLLIIVLSFLASLVGSLNFLTLDFKEFTTVSGENVEVLTQGIYKYNIKPWVLSGIPWDLLRLVVGLPLLIISFIFYIKDSLKGTIIFISMIFNFFYQYLLWSIGWHFNALFLIYTLIFGLSLTVLILLVVSIDKDRIMNSVKDSFPVKLVAVFLFFISGMLFLNVWVKLCPLCLVVSCKSSLLVIIIFLIRRWILV